MNEIYCLIKNKNGYFLGYSRQKLLQLQLLWITISEFRAWTIESPII